MASPRVPVRAVWPVRAARILALLTAVLCGVGLLTARPGGINDPAQTVLLAASAMTFAAVGALLVGRLQRHPVAWLLLWGGGWMAVGVAAGGLSDYGLVVRPDSIPGAVWLAWISEWSWAPYVAAFALLPLYFPTGSVPGPRWRFVGVLGIAVAVVGSAQSALSPWSPDPYSIPNPTQLGDRAGAVLAMLNAVGYALTVTTIALAALSVIARYRRASGVEAAQLRWFASAAVLAGALGAATISISTVAPPTPAWHAAGYVTALLSFLGILLLPVAIGVAILRYRLYDIDRIVSRTIGWTIVSGTLVAVFVTVVVGLEALLAGFTQGQTLSVAASTLAVFALFQPLRRRVQRAVDRRFYRARDDGQRIASQYAERLREELDLGQIGVLTREAVVAAVRPAVIALWLRRQRP